MGSIILAESNPIELNPVLHQYRMDTLEKRRQKSEKYTLGLVYDYDHLYLSFKGAQKNSSWKKTVQEYEKNAGYNIFKLSQDLQNETYIQKPFYEFPLNERGKLRLIKAMNIQDRVVQRCVSDYILVPLIQDYLIYDNGASMEKKGISFCRDRFEHHVHSFYRHHGSEGYILKVDFAKFFDNLLHSYIKAILHDLIIDEGLQRLIDSMIDSFKLDVSYMDDDEYAQCLVTTFNSIDYQFLSEGHMTGEKMMEKSVGIGSHLSQICGILYLNELDNYCKTVLGLKYYGRYMDDIYIIHESKEYLQNLLVYMDNYCGSIGLHLNKKKTQITKLSKGMTFLQIKYNLTDTGHLVRRPSPKTFTRERRRLKSYQRLLETNRITYLEVANCYKSWRGNLEKYDCHNSLLNMDRVFLQRIGMTADYIVENYRPAFFFPENIEGLDRRNFYTDHLPVDVNGARRK